jgi:pheromone shutdown-related protein TraB
MSGHGTPDRSDDADTDGDADADIDVDADVDSGPDSHSDPDFVAAGTGDSDGGQAVAVEGGGEGSVRLVGTAHVSAASVAEVESVVESERPDVVAVELDERRYRQMQGETPEDLDPADLLRGSMAFQFLAYWLLSYVQSRLGERFDIEPGADMKAGVEAAGQVGADLALVDRDIQVTVQRFWERMTLREKLGLVWQLGLAVVGIGGVEETEAFDPEDLTDRDVVTAMMEEFRRFSPGGAEALIDERDAYIAHKLAALRESGFDVVAVVGAGHREGIERYLADPASLPPMDSLVGNDGGGISWFRAAGLLVTLGFLAFFVLLVMAALGGGGEVSTDALVRVLVAWFLFNAVLAAGLARLAGAHWDAAAVGGAVAWLTSVDPLLAPGWFAGYVELRHQAVNIADIGRLNEILGDEESPVRDLLGQMIEVPLFRLIAVVAMTNVGSMLATFLFPVLVLPFLGGPFDSVPELAAAMEAGVRNSVDAIARLLR